MDDGSTDRTAEIMAEMALRDKRVRLEFAPALPSGWNGKQHACWALAHVAKHPLLCFMDADVRLEPEALSRMAAFLVRSDAQLVSGFPRQITETTMEWLLLPLIHYCPARLSADLCHASWYITVVRRWLWPVPDDDP